VYNGPPFRYTTDYTPFLARSAAVRPRLFGAFAVLVVTLPGLAEAPDGKATIAYLRKLQTKEGGFVADAGKTNPSLRATSSALRALKYFGGEAPDRAAAGRFVESCFDKETGGFADAPGGKPDVPTTAVGAMALVELHLPTAPYEAGVLHYLGEHAKTFEDIRIAAAGVDALGKLPAETKEWVHQIEGMKQANGTFGDARQTGGATVALLRLGGKLDEPQAIKILANLNGGQNADGGFGKGNDAKSDLETTYRVMRCYNRLNVTLDAPRKRLLLGFLERCRNADGGYGVAPGQPSSVSGTYYAGIIRHWQGEP
jgi:prenyltransferase beta subunit